MKFKVALVWLFTVVVVTYWWHLPSQEAACAQLGNEVGAIATFADGRCRVGNDFAHAIRESAH